jgi:formyltetrahydrofolate deformylase
MVLPKKDSTTATLLVSCSDRPGLVAALSQLLFALGLNILDADQHTDSSAGKFFQRIRFDLAVRDSGSVIDKATLLGAIREVADRHGMEWDLRLDRDVPRMAIFVSKTDHCLYDLLLRHRSGELHCDIPLIISNHPDLEPIAEQFGIDYRVYPITKDTKTAQEQLEIELLREYRIDLVVMARYMQILPQANHQHPSFILTRLSRWEALSPGLQPRRKADRGDRALRDPGSRRRPNY